jgi:sugar O-acyltransferase (sialic acid O-acetyltransferase NeuD family)
MMTESSSSKLPVIVIGAGGHAKVLISTLLLQHRTVLGFVDLISSAPVLGVTQLGDDNSVLQHSPKQVCLVNGVGSAGSTNARRAVYDRFRQLQYIFENVIHPSAIIAPEVEIEDGVQIMAGAVIQPGALLGSNAIINTGARVDHDCLIAAHVHIAPGVTLSGNVQVGTSSHVGTGASVIQGVKIGVESVVGAGAVVLRDVSDRAKVVGVPAIPIKTPVASRG